MHDLYYLEITILIIIAAIIMLIIIFQNSLLPKSKKKSLFLLYFLLIISTILEFFGVYLNNKPSNTILLHGFIKAFEYSLVPYLCVQIANIIDTKKPSKWPLILIGANTIFQFVSIGTGLSFYIDSNNVYQHGSFNWVYTVMWVFSSLYAVLRCVQYGLHFQTKNVFTPLMLLSLPVIGVVMREINSEVRLEMVCITFTSVFLYIYYLDIIQKSDPLTGLLNRGSYIGKTSSMDGKAMILYFDVDDFKSYNDKYGHDYGDKILCSVAKNIKEVYSKFGLCYRIGGDEFCVILKGDLDNIEELNQKFKDQILKVETLDKRPMTVSVGFSNFDPQKDNIEEAIHLADKEMYRTKEKLKIELQESNAKLMATVKAFQIAAQSSSSLVFVYDLHNQRIVVDKMTAKAFGVAEIQNGVPYETAKMGIISDDTVEEYIKVHQEILDGAKQSKGLIDLIDTDGNKTTQELTLTAVFDDKGKPTGTAVGVYTQVH